MTYMTYMTVLLNVHFASCWSQHLTRNVISASIWCNFLPLGRNNHAHLMISFVFLDLPLLLSHGAAHPTVTNTRQCPQALLRNIETQVEDLDTCSFETSWNVGLSQVCMMLPNGLSQVVCEKTDLQSIPFR